MNIGYDLVVNIVAGFIGALIVLIVLEKRKRPKIEFSVDSKPYEEPNFKLLRVLVYNKAMGWPLKYLYEREPAIRCQAWINFYYSDGRPVYMQGEMQGRWSDTPIPITVSRQYNPWQIENSFDISADNQAKIDVVFKYLHEEKCYGFNNESYNVHEYRSNWVIDKGQYIVRVRVKTGEQSFSDVFRLVNEMDFRLEEIQDKAIKRQLK